MSEAGTCPKKGERYIVRTEFVALVLINWRAPMTSGDEKSLPVGLEFVIDADPLPHSTGAAARPDPYEVWESKLLSQADRDSEKYGGYYLVIKFDQLFANCSLAEAPKNGNLS
jgi:hypothetical protein